MTTPSDPPKPARWRRQQLEMRLRKGEPPGPERRAARATAGGASGSPRCADAARPGAPAQRRGRKT